MKALFSSLVLIALCLVSLPGSARASLIDLNDFYADPTVVVEADGSTATMVEVSDEMAVFLSNDPFLGDPEVILAQIGGVGQILSFDYDFVEGSGNVDEFRAVVFDGDLGAFDPSGILFEFFADSTASGTLSFDLSGLVGTTLGLEFQLNSLDYDPDSMVTISNVQLNPVPIPGALLLAGLGIGTSISVLRKRRRLPE